MFNVTLNLSETVQSVPPVTTVDVDLNGAKLVVELSGGSWAESTDPTIVALWGGPNATHRYGITIDATANTPQDFENGTNHGFITYAQLVTPNRNRDGFVPYDKRYTPNSLVNGVQGLDEGFPYQEYTTVYDDTPDDYQKADGRTVRAVDSPHESLSNGVTLDPTVYHKTTDFDSFRMNLLYLAPGASKYVPLGVVEWYWKAHAERLPVGTGWSIIVNERAYQYLTYPAHPVWTYRHHVLYWDYK
jgi:hypothetical protein